MRDYKQRGLADAVPDGKTDDLCECSDTNCTEKIELKLFEYEAVRARPKCFFIVPGHERPEVERVVDHNHRYATALDRNSGSPVASAGRVKARSRAAGVDLLVHARAPIEEHEQVPGGPAA